MIRTEELPVSLPGLRAVRLTALSLSMTVAALATWAGCASSTTDSFAGGGSGGSDSSGSTSTATGGDACPGATLCGDACTNTAFDPSNCGACGHDCGGGTCDLGVCAPVVLRDSLASPAFDIDGTSFYFNSGSKVLSCPLAGCVLS